MKTMVYTSVFLSLRRHSKELTSFSSTVQMRQRFMFRPQVFSLVVQRRLVPSLHSNDPQHNQQHAHANLEIHVRTRTEKNELMVTTDVIFVEEWTSQSINQPAHQASKQAIKGVIKRSFHHTTVDICARSLIRLALPKSPMITYTFHFQFFTSIHLVQFISQKYR